MLPPYQYCINIIVGTGRFRGTMGRGLNGFDTPSAAEVLIHLALGLVAAAGRSSYRIEEVMRKNVRIVLGRSPSHFLSIHACTTDIRSRKVFFRLPYRGLGRVFLSLHCIASAFIKVRTALSLSLSSRSKQQPYKMINETVRHTYP